MDTLPLGPLGEIALHLGAREVAALLWLSRHLRSSLSGATGVWRRLCQRDWSGTLETEWQKSHARAEWQQRYLGAEARAVRWRTHKHTAHEIPSILRVEGMALAGDRLLLSLNYRRIRVLALPAGERVAQWALGDESWPDCRGDSSLGRLWLSAQGTLVTCAGAALSARNPLRVWQAGPALASLGASSSPSGSPCSPRLEFTIPRLTNTLGDLVEVFIGDRIILALVSDVTAAGHPLHELDRRDGTTLRHVHLSLRYVSRVWLEWDEERCILHDRQHEACACVTPTGPVATPDVGVLVWTGDRFLRTEAHDGATAWPAGARRLWHVSSLETLLTLGPIGGDPNADAVALSTEMGLGDLPRARDRPLSAQQRRLLFYHTVLLLAGEDIPPLALPPLLAINARFWVYQSKRRDVLRVCDFGPATMPT